MLWIRNVILNPSFINEKYEFSHGRKLFGKYVGSKLISSSKRNKHHQAETLILEQGKF